MRTATVVGAERLGVPGRPVHGCVRRVRFGVLRRGDRRAVAEHLAVSATGARSTRRALRRVRRSGRRHAARVRRLARAAPAEVSVQSGARWRRGTRPCVRRTRSARHWRADGLAGRRGAAPPLATRTSRDRCACGAATQGRGDRRGGRRRRRARGVAGDRRAVRGWGTRRGGRRALCARCGALRAAGVCSVAPHRRAPVARRAATLGTSDARSGGARRTGR